jgi:S-adenosylmethionine:tRNA ribosyltransferase-isomerase
MSEHLSDYDYRLPEELIAQHPAEPRDSSRLLVIHRAQAGKAAYFEHRTFSDLVEYLDEKDLLVANNTKVLKARLLGKRLLPGGALGGKTEFVLLEQLRPRIWEGLFHASAKYLPGLEFECPTPDGAGIRGKLVKGSGDSPSGNVVVEFDRDPVEADAGEIPLPKYIRRDSAAPGASAEKNQDENLYQTVYAKELGSAAAPTAGLHFTDRVMRGLREKKVDWAEVTLHVGVGTFRPVKTEDISAHVMHEERYQIASDVAEKITVAKHEGKRIVAVGTTSVRTLEGAWDPRGAAAVGASIVRAGSGRTSLFIRPGHHEFKVVDRMITNFHLPKSTLLMLVCTFAGKDIVLRAYEEAVREKYRFFSYGDAMLIL